MTRVNCIDPNMLNNKHLGAAWNETPRIITDVEKLIKEGYKPNEISIPEQYVFGTGHMKFFYNKLHYIKNYLFYIWKAGCMRDLNYSKQLMLEYDNRIEAIRQEDIGWYGVWRPSQEDIYLNMARLVFRHYDFTLYDVNQRSIIKRE